MIDFEKGTELCILDLLHSAQDKEITWERAFWELVKHLEDYSEIGAIMWLKEDYEFKTITEDRRREDEDARRF